MDSRWLCTCQDVRPPGALGRTHGLRGSFQPFPYGLRPLAAARRSMLPPLQCLCDPPGAHSDDLGLHSAPSHPAMPLPAPAPCAWAHTNLQLQHTRGVERYGRARGAVPQGEAALWLDGVLLKYSMYRVPCSKVRVYGVSQACLGLFLLYVNPFAMRRCKPYQFRGSLSQIVTWTFPLRAYGTLRSTCSTWTCPTAPC